MAESPPTVRTGRRSRRRRGGRVVTVVVLGALAVLIGRGLGLVGRDPSPDVPPAADEVPSARGSGGGAPAHNAPAQNAPAAPLAEAPVAATAGKGIEADRFASLLSVLDTCAARGDIGNALATLQQLRQMPLDEPQRLALAGSARTVETELATACGKVVQALCQGRVLDGHALFVRMLGETDPLTQSWLSSALQVAGLGDVPLQPVRTNDGPIPQPQALPRGRAVRVLRGNNLAAAVVADSRSDQVTVRIEDGSGMSFPTVARTQCEPVAPTRDEAIEMAFAALHAGEPLLARLWFACGKLLDASPLSPRGERLAALLR